MPLGGFAITGLDCDVYLTDHDWRPNSCIFQRRNCQDNLSNLLRMNARFVRRYGNIFHRIWAIPSGRILAAALTDCRVLNCARVSSKMATRQSKATSSSVSSSSWCLHLHFYCFLFHCCPIKLQLFGFKSKSNNITVVLCWCTTADTHMNG